MLHVGLNPGARAGAPAASHTDAIWLYFGDLYGTRGFTAADQDAPLRTSRRRSGQAVQANPSDFPDALLDLGGWRAAVEMARNDGWNDR
jgi:hypothetical protein